MLSEQEIKVLDSGQVRRHIQESRDLSVCQIRGKVFEFRDFFGSRLAKGKNKRRLSDSLNSLELFLSLKALSLLTKGLLIKANFKKT